MTIDFKGKQRIAACMDRIRAAGHWVQVVDSTIQCSDEAAVQAIIDNFSLADAKAARIAEVLAHAKRQRDHVVSATSPGEMACWPIKRAEAEQYAASGGTSACPVLTVEAQYRGVTLQALVEKVQANSTRLATMEAQIGGNDGKHRDAIAALSTFEAVANYNYLTGWPFQLEP